MIIVAKDKQMAVLCGMPTKHESAIFLLMQAYKVNCCQAPKYISDLVSTVAATATRPGLRSGKTMNYSLPRLRTKFGERAFSYSGPAAWNRLPHDVRASPSLNVFKRKLKTRIFKSISLLTFQHFNVFLYDIVMHRRPTLLQSAYYKSIYNMI